MPRRIPTQVGESLSRLVRGGYLKSVPRSYETMLLHPPAPLPPRTPTARSSYDTTTAASSSHAHSLDLDTPRPRRDPLNAKKKHHAQKPKLTPQPIVYLADRIRSRFYKDHPWETLRPRVLVEAEKLAPARKLGPEAADLRYWGRNPGPEEVVACTLHLHEHHGLSLSQAYHHTLSSYHALRAEHETASRSALFEALAYGATFNNSPALPNGSGSGGAAETVRGYQKEANELAKGAAYFYQSRGEAAVADNATALKAKRIKNPSTVFSKGEQYLQAALASREMSNLPVSESAGRRQGLNNIESQD